LLYAPNSNATGEVFDPVLEIEKLEDRPKVRAILSSMVKRHRYADVGTPEYLYLTGVVWAAGRLGLGETSDTLAEILVDSLAEATVRALAAKSCG
jgi:hypothetical protein